MSAGSGNTMIKLEPTREADLRVALAIEQVNGCMLKHTVEHQRLIIEHLNRYITRLNARSSN